MAVFDVAAAKVVKYLPTAGKRALIAAGREHLLVVNPDDKTVERWSLTTLKKEATADLGMKEVPVAAAMGSASDGPLLVCGAGRSAGETVFLDPRTLRRYPVGDPRYVFFSASPDAVARASADGRVFAVSPGPSTVQRGGVLDRPDGPQGRPRGPAGPNGPRAGRHPLHLGQPTQPGHDGGRQATRSRGATRRSRGRTTSAPTSRGRRRPL